MIGNSHINAQFFFLIEGHKCWGLLVHIFFLLDFTTSINHLRFFKFRKPYANDIYFIFSLKITGEALIQRKDDTAEVLKSRLDSFHRQTEPVLNILISQLHFMVCFYYCYFMNVNSIIWRKIAKILQ